MIRIQYNTNSEEPFYKGGFLYEIKDGFAWIVDFKHGRLEPYSISHIEMRLYPRMDYEVHHPESKWDLTNYSRENNKIFKILKNQNELLNDIVNESESD